jgi:hypothetical protein
MKYFTKEWCQLQTNLHLSLEESKEAESFSEEYFQRVYDEELNKFLSFEQELSSASFDDLYPQEMEIESIQDDLSAEEIQKLKQNYAMKREVAKESYIPQSYNREEAIDQFTEAYFANLAYLKPLIPEAILREIADIRVFVLDRASRKVIEELKSFSEKNQILADKISENYQRYYQDAYGDSDPMGDASFHDCKIVEAFQEKNEFTLILDNSGAFTDIRSIKFTNCEILLQEMPLENAWWVYDEIYRNGGNHELHVLFESNNRDPFYFTILFEKAIFE